MKVLTFGCQTRSLNPSPVIYWWYSLGLSNGDDCKTHLIKASWTVQGVHWEHQFGFSFTSLVLHSTLLCPQEQIYRPSVQVRCLSFILDCDLHGGRECNCCIHHSVPVLITVSGMLLSHGICWMVDFSIKWMTAANCFLPSAHMGHHTEQLVESHKVKNSFGLFLPFMLS
jgi:hypothetical protein